MGIEPYLIAGSLLGVVAQRLVPRICPKCRKEIPAPADMKKYGLDRAYRGEGCDFCGHTGYRGRFGLYEQFDVTLDIAEAISSGASVATLKEMAKKNGMRSLLDLGIESAAQGETTPEEMIRVVGEA
jgi:type II secretory ATPase GspE/PulE/Tfp pilus assembly ATPase PilB-like protein